VTNYLDSKLTRMMFIEQLHKCERNFRHLNQSEAGFVVDMKANLLARADAKSLGLPDDKLWNPTVKQINYLRAISERYS